MVAEIVRVVGIHLLQTLDLVGSPRRSAVARLDGAGRLEALALADGDDEVAAAVPDEAAWVVVDAPLAVPNARGRRDAERVLAWCDVPAFPVSRERLERVFGGARGVALARALARPGRELRETLPDLVLRELEWEREHPPDAPALDLADYRPAWLGIRAPAYRPKGRGRARPAGMARAHDLLSGALDLGGWARGSRRRRLGRPSRCRAPGRPLLRLRGAAARARGGRGDRRRPRLGTRLLSRRREPPRAGGAHPEAARRRGGHRARRPLTRRVPGPLEPRRKDPVMASSVYRVIDVIGTSDTSWEDATAAAVATASGSLRDLRVAEVTKLDVTIGDDGKVQQYRARIALSFKYESD